MLCEILSPQFRAGSSGISRAHANVYRELRHGNKGNGWTVMEITREGLNKNTMYNPRGIR